MLVVLLNWVFIASTVFCVGFIIAKLVKAIFHYHIKDITSIIITGIIATTVYAQAWSLFYKVGVIAYTVLFVCCIIIVLAFYKEILAVLQQELCVSAIRKILLFIMIVIWSYCTSRGYMHYDSDLYHAQSIRWIEEFGIVKGLGNIHVRFAYNSSLFALSALYSMPWLFGQSLHCVNGFLALILCMEALRIVEAWSRKTLLASDYARAASLYYLTLIYREITSPASDYAVMCIVFYIVIKWLSLVEVKETNAAPYALLCVCGTYAISLKLTAGLILLLVIKPLSMLIRQRKWRDIAIYLTLGTIVLTPWLARTIMISGYLLYPFPDLDIFKVDWKIPFEAAALDAAEIKTWGRGLNNALLVNMKIWEWFPIWFRSTLPAIGKILVIIDLACLILGGIYFLIVLLKKEWERLDMLLVWSVVAICYLFWQLSAPLLRYGYAYVLLLIVLTIYIIMSIVLNLKYISIRQSLLVKAECLILLALAIAKIYSLGNYIIDSCNQSYYVRQKDYGTYELDKFNIEGIDFYYPKEGDRVGYDDFPAIPRKVEIVFRGKEIKSGFKN